MVKNAASLKKFIATESLTTGSAEQRVWDVVCEVFAPRECLAYWRYPIFSKVGEYRKEPDILIVDFELGLIIIEVKGITLEQIVNINGHQWQFQNFYVTRGNPYQQAERQLYALLEYCNREAALYQKVRGCVLVALPLIRQQQWQQRGFDQLPSCPPILFRDQVLAGSGKPNENQQQKIGDHPIHSLSLIESIQQLTPLIPGKPFTQEQWKLLQAVISGTPIFKSQPRRFLLHRGNPESRHPFCSTPPTPSPQLPSRASILVQARQSLFELDLQQERIGKTIPPGPQRIRGIAGSGKTVLLCQKAAAMHLKHPDWDIALVFFSRSLYDLITQQLDKWLRHFSCHQLQYHLNHPKLRVLHAWGAKEQPGLYSTLCAAAGVYPKGVYHTERQQPNEGLAEVCRALLKTAKIPAIFDAILLDEGQDFMVDDELKFEDKQPFYWMAYQALRPVANVTHSTGNFSPALGLHAQNLRRLIWAYDEAQSLENLKIPTASELFGDELGQLVTGEYHGGIKKSEMMPKCYRTPGTILTVAHGIGMGLLRPTGILTGMTRIADWNAIGYEVIRNREKWEKIAEEISENDPSPTLILGEKVTLYRPPENSPNPIPKLWPQPVVEFEAYQTRQEELIALADQILYNLKIDGLRPSREILVIVLGPRFEAWQLETYVANFLFEQGIDIFIPGTTHCNCLKPDQETADPNQFWCEGGVTVSRIHRAKGHEADMVYIIGLDQVAQAESNLSLRNQLFVALTRSRGWVRLSGVGTYPLYEELWNVMQSGNQFTFVLRKAPQRDISMTEVGELLRRYAAGDRNFQGVILADMPLEGVNLKAANLIGSQLQGANLANATLDAAKLVAADLSQSVLIQASLQRAKLVGSILFEAKLNDANLSHADLSDVDLKNAHLINANLQNANLNGADLRGANLTGANLKGAALADANLTDAILINITMPDGKLYQNFWEDTG